MVCAAAGRASATNPAAIHQADFPAKPVIRAIATYFTPRRKVADPGGRVNVHVIRLSGRASLLQEAMSDTPFADPLAWRPVRALSLDEMEALARAAFARLPGQFRRLCEDVIVRVEDFPTDEVMDEMGCETPFDLLGLFQGVGLPSRAGNDMTGTMPNMVWL